jgi:hypothetical protein
MGFGERITLRGRVLLRMVLKEQTVQVENIDKEAPAPIQLGTMTVNIRQVVSSPAEGDGPRVLGIKVEATPRDSAVKPPDRGELTVVNGAVRIDTLVNNNQVEDHWTRLQATGNGGVKMNGKDEFIVDGLDQTGAGGRGPGNRNGFVVGAVGQMVVDDRPMPLFDAPWLQLFVVDATGKQVLTARIPSDSTTTTIRATQAHFQGPLRVVLKFPTQTADLVVPFEFKDIPIQR